MIDRDLESAASHSFDLVVVGGGIHGVCLTLEAARRGLRTILVERQDFGCGTSWNSLRILHGGLRYLQTLDLKRFRDSVRERSWWLRHFPDQARPLPCLMPLYGDGPYKPSVLRAALAANDWLSRHRNEGLTTDRTLAPGELLSASETIELFPDVMRRGLRGAALWYDATASPQRLLMELLRWANHCGAVTLNYVAAVRLKTDNGQVSGLVVFDHEKGEEFEITAPAVVNCAGPWCREVATSFDRDLPELFHRSLAFNLLLERDALSPAALAVRSRNPGARTYFLTPSGGRVLVGTYHAGSSALGDSGDWDQTLITTMLADLNAAVPGLDLGLDEVLRVYWGLLPARAAGSEHTARRSVIYHHGAAEGPRGLVSVSGIKYTTARSLAARTLVSTWRWLGRELPPLAGPDRPAPANWPKLDEFLALAESDPEQAATEVRRIVDDEAVLHLDDLVLRRTDWGEDPRRLEALGSRITTLLRWDDDSRRQEIRKLVERAGQDG